MATRVPGGTVAVAPAAAACVSRYRPRGRPKSRNMLPFTRTRRRPFAAPAVSGRRSRQ
ncbi:hypothetical protein ACFVY4_33775 [Streptomyces sp. NPDC058299]|uniref:hypothetical protein n=1 Tax=Streptomyces sp. NPDC058299 TaxID=3346435 RepID=UPI0036E63CAD